VTRPRWRCGSADYYTCGTYGFMMNEVGESHREAAHCPRCTLAIEDQAREMLDSAERRSVLDQVSDLLAGLDDNRGELRGVCWTTRNPMAGVFALGADTLAEPVEAACGVPFDKLRARFAPGLNPDGGKR
jgi:hypothetical protein